MHDEQLLKSDIMELQEAFNSGVRSGREHSLPSPQTLIFMQETNQKLAKLDSDVEVIKDDLHEIKNRVPNKDELRAIIAEFKNSIDKEHEAKFTRKEEFMDLKNFIEKINWLVISSVILAIVGLVVGVDKLLK